MEQREIKFRVLDKEHEKWHYFGIWGILTRPSDIGETYDLETISQWIGLKDKNGRDIYEGDICKIVNIFCQPRDKKRFSKRIGRTGLILYTWCAFNFYSDTGGEDFSMGICEENGGSDLSFDDEIDGDDLEVIDNIYENPQFKHNCIV